MDERTKVINFIKTQQDKRFRVIDNTGQDKSIVAGQFPDIIFLQLEPPPNTNILFVLKVETATSNFVDSVSEWKAYSTVPIVFYIVVPRARLDEAKKIAVATGTKAKFAWYRIEDNEVKEVFYE